MVDSSVASDIFFSVALLLICIVVLLLLRFYLPLRTTPAYILVPVFLAIALPASIVLLVPIDLASTAGVETSGLRGIWLPHRVILVSWRISYWLTFALTWAILPLLGEYTDSGDREPKDKILYSLRSNGQYWAIVLGACILGAIYFFIQLGFKMTSLKDLLMELAYAWGLILALYLMGHGLVALPRRLFRNASVPKRLKMLQSRAPKVHDRLEDAIDQLDLYESEVLQLRQRKTGTAKDFQEWIEELSEAASLPESRSTGPAERPRTTVPPVITERYLANLTRKLKRARHKKMRFVDEWDRLVQSAVETQAILDSAASKRLEFHAKEPQSGWLRYSILTPYTRYILHYHIVPAAYYTLAVFLSLASITVLWSSTVKSLEPKLSLLGWSVVHHHKSDRSQIGLTGQLIAAIWILYMCICALYSVTEVKVWGNRALVRRGTYPESACWYSMQVAKLTVPLTYNFITFLPPNIYLNTIFHGFLGKPIESTPLGKTFQSYVPIFLLLPAAAALFGVYGRVKSWFSFGDMMEDEDDAEGGPATPWREGRALIERETHSGTGLPGTRGASVGLAPRDDGPQRYHDDPQSAGPSSTAGTSSSHAERPRPGRPQWDRRPVTGGADYGDENVQGGSFFGDFAERVRNTFETRDFSFERPKWLGGGERSRREGRPTGGYRALRGEGNERNEGWRSLFGGRTEGRLRI